MKQYRRWLTALLAAAVISASALASVRAIPAQTPFAELRIDATDMDIPERTISVSLYHRDESGQFQPDSLQAYSCKLNRATRDAAFFIQSQSDGVWVTVDYLTDINGDGVYELLEDEAAPVWDVMDAQGVLAQPQAEDELPLLEAGLPYILSPDMLIRRSQQAVQSRLAEGSCPLDVGQEAAEQTELPVCMVRLHRTDPEDGLDYEQTYYVQISDNVRMASDVSPDDWYYDAVDFVLKRGYFVGSTSGLFLPEGQLTRAQLAQVLWAMNGYPQAETAAGFSDVADDDWFAGAVSWCHQEALISGRDDGSFAPHSLLTREQLSAVLYRCAQRAGVSLRTDVELDRFPDSDETSSWAAESVRWAVTHDLLHLEKELLRPRAVVTRAELAWALYSYAMNFELYSSEISGNSR